MRHSRGHLPTNCLTILVYHTSMNVTDNHFWHRHLKMLMRTHLANSKYMQAFGIWNLSSCLNQSLDIGDSKTRLGVEVSSLSLSQISKLVGMNSFGKGRWNFRLTPTVFHFCGKDYKSTKDWYMYLYWKSYTEHPCCLLISRKIHFQSQWFALVSDKVF